MMQKNRNIILQALADGQFRSGTELGELAGVTRTAVAKHVDALKALGLDIFSVRGKGYKLAQPINLLVVDKIQAAFQQRSGVAYPASMHVVPLIDSTNTYIKDHLYNLESGAICTAESQSAGRGRQGRTWVSPFASSIYLSMYWRFAGGYQTLSGLSLVVGLAVADALDDLGISGVQLKWPNDIYVNMQKIAGILIEIEGSVGDEVDCVIGVGVNVQLPENVDTIDQPFTDCVTQLGQRVDRNTLIANILYYLHQYLNTFSLHGMLPFKEQWERRDAFFHKPVMLLAGQNSISGIGMGIGETGALLLQVDGEIKAFHGGEISVRAG